MVITGLFSCCSNKPDALHFSEIVPKAVVEKVAKAVSQNRLVGWVGLGHWISL